MAELAYCGNCGGEIPATAKFCKHCGTDQAAFQLEEPTATAMSAPSPAQPPTPPPPPQGAPAPPPPAASPPPPPAPPGAGARESAERVAPGVGDLFEQLGAHLSSPGVALAGLSALLGAGVCLAAGLILALVLPHASFLAIGGGAGLFEETLAQAASFSQANLHLVGSDEAVRTVPVLFLLFPVLGVAAGVAGLSARAAGMAVRERFLWALAAGIPFAFLMAIATLSIGEVQFDLFANEVEFSVGSVFLLSLLWGSLGGALGMLFAFRGAAERADSPLPAGLARYPGIAWSGLRPLLLALLAVGVLGTAAWGVQVVRDESYREFPPRGTVVAVGEQLTYAGDHAIDILPLGAGASERLAGPAAIPIDQDQYFDLPSEPAASSPSNYNLFDFNDTMPAFLFVPMLILLIAIPALFALYAGFAIARRLGESRADRAAAWGALVGPLWAISMVLLATLARKNVVGNPTGDSVFVAFLLGGALLGAIGGLLAAQGAIAGRTEQPVASQPPPPAA